MHNVRTSKWTLGALAVVMILVVAACGGGGSADDAGGGGNSADVGSATSVEASAPSASPTTAAPTTAPATTAPAPTTTTEPPADPVDVVIEANPAGYVLTGRVPDQATADELMAIFIDNGWGEEFVLDELEVDDTMRPGGTRRVSVEGTVLEGNAGFLESVLPDWTSGGPDSVSVTATELNGFPIEVIASYSRGFVSLDGELLSQEQLDSLVATAGEAFGADRLFTDGLFVTDDPDPSRGGLLVLAFGELDSDFVEGSTSWLEAWAEANDADYWPGQLSIRQVSELESALNEISRNDPVTFETGSANVTPEGQATLDRLVELLAAEPPFELWIEGHTDSQGSEDANFLLSSLRAEAVRDYFAAAGIDTSLMEAFGLGEQFPVATNETDEGRAQNRRISFVIPGEGFEIVEE